ncbi:unnamed protein product [Brachionus calyciflorus]|uniref:Uncharacterized protein n=1 Tax=Brachionus calyciflorus TaxID=104777 RepID=A0A814GET0_9BILA|nr:unnamed protein product [Brachionus calyciflorus]
MKKFGSTRPVLNDITNKITYSGTQNLIIKLDEEKNPIIKSQSASNLDFNRNEIKVPETKNSFHHNSPKLGNFDQNSHLYVTEYTVEIIIYQLSYLLELEKKINISDRFLNRFSNQVVETRSRLVNTIVRAQNKFSLCQEVPFLTVQIFDRYLDLTPIEEIDLILLTATAFFIASKYEDKSKAYLSLIDRMIGNSYTRLDIRKMEVVILEKLDLSIPLPLEFLRRFSMINGFNSKNHIVAMYFLELSLLDFEFSVMKPSYLAACAFCLSIKLFNKVEWSQKLEIESTYKLIDLSSGMQKLAQLVLKVNQLDFEYKETWKKFNEPSMFQVSSMPELNGVKIREIALGI